MIRQCRRHALIKYIPLFAFFFIVHGGFFADKMNLNPIRSVKAFFADSRHVLSVSYKPDANTFKRTIKIVLIGTLILGFMGFIFSLIIGLFTGGV